MERSKSSKSRSIRSPNRFSIDSTVSGKRLDPVRGTGQLGTENSNGLRGRADPLWLDHVSTLFSLCIHSRASGQQPDIRLFLQRAEQQVLETPRVISSSMRAPVSANFRSCVASEELCGCLRANSASILSIVRLLRVWRRWQFFSLPEQLICDCSTERNSNVESLAFGLTTYRYDTF